jgi:sugar phosphate isomerase/epimerase
MRADQISLELYTVRDAAKEDFAGTLAKVAQIGYPAVEFAGLHGWSAEEVRAILDQNNLKGASAHVPFTRFVEEFDTVIAEMRTLGCGYAIVPWIGPEHRSTVAAARAFADQVGEIGTKVRNAGLGFAYHNHDFEFADLEGTGSRLWDFLFEKEDVDLELDVYWVFYGGADPAALVAQAPERYPLLHFKDMAGTGADRRDAPVGKGNVDFAPLLKSAEARTLYYVVEQDNPVDAFADIATSYAGMRALVG